MSKFLTLQEIIERLKAFWKQNNCLIFEGFDCNIGAATLAPFTSLNVIEKTPWNFCQVQYCRRPTDGRFGENPNRLSGYYQMQVILKPVPQNPQEIYKKSIESLGFDLTENDIRFIEDNWENPSIGASGVGFEVWINGMECSQWTYMQQIGGIPLKTTPLEITYGLERLAMYIQNVESIFDITWGYIGGKPVKYGEIFKRKEVHLCNFYTNEADISILAKRFSEYESSSKKLCDSGFFEAAHEEALAASNMLNILDARGALSQIDRADKILRVRELVKNICQNLSQD